MKTRLGTFVGVLVSILGSLASAQTGTVSKVKGRQAIVNFPAENPPTEGQTVYVGQPGESAQRSVAAVGSRDHTVGLSGELSMKSNSSNSTSTTAFSVSGRYGWNKRQYEFGPIAGFGYSKTDPSSE